jgi:RNA polymerase sigma-70 factor (ECF subfamily)
LSAKSTFTEEELVRALQQQDREAFSYLYDNYSAALNGTIFRMVDDTGIAEDILQEVFIKIWTNISSYDTSKGRLFTWMLQIAKNLTIDTLRSKGYKQQAKISSDENSVTNIDDGGIDLKRADGIGLRKQLLHLKPEYRLMIEMAYFKGYTQDEISKETNIPLGTVKTRIRAAIIELKKILQ